MPEPRTDSHELPTPRSTLRARYVRVSLNCRSCLHQADADLEALIDAGRGDVPLIELRWRCTRCGHRCIDVICTGKHVVVPGDPAKLAAGGQYRKRPRHERHAVTARSRGMRCAARL
jgi:hypothetical protein